MMSVFFVVRTELALHWKSGEREPKPNFFEKKSPQTTQHASKKDYNAFTAAAHCPGTFVSFGRGQEGLVLVNAFDHLFCFQNLYYWPYFGLLCTGNLFFSRSKVKDEDLDKKLNEYDEDDPDNPLAKVGY